jgi:Holliday junction resolvasome RuvABC endonuclease subunit
VIVLGLDSAEATGYAVVERDAAGERLVRYGVVPARPAHAAADVAAAVAELAAVGPDVVAVEEPFIHPRNPSTGLVLARLLGRWLQALEARGLTTVTVPASMWQPGVLPGVTWATRSAERKAAAVAFARERFGVQATEDEADAIALAVYVARTATRRAA